MAAVSRDKIPMAPEAEKAVLGAILLDQRLPDAPIDKSLFYGQSNREILEVIQDIAADDEMIDPVQIAERLRQKGRLDAVGTPYIASLTDGAIRSNFPAAVRLLEETAAKREIWLAASHALDDSLNGKGSAEIIGEITRKIEKIGVRGARSRRWPEPLPLPEGRTHAPHLNPAILPNAIAPWLEDICERLQVPLDFAAIPAIVSIATAIGSKIRIRPKKYDDWTVVPNLWGAIIGDPGLLKSPSIEQATKPLRRLIARAEEKHGEQLKQYEIEAEIEEERRKGLMKEIRATIERGEDATALRAELSEPPVPPQEKRYLVNDATVEKLGELLALNRNGLLMFRDELTGWLKTLDRENNANERAFYLESWNGGQPYTYDRIGRGTTKIPNTTMSVIGGIQPGPLAAYLEAANAAGAGADGLMQRFQLAVWPDRISGYEHIDRYPKTDAKNAAFQVFECLDSLTPADPRFQDAGGEDGYVFLRFDSDAQALFDDWYTELQNRIRSSQLDPAFTSHLAKYGSLFSSLALIFHLCDTACDQIIPDVSLAAAQKALMWCDYLEGHARKIYGLQAAEAGEAVRRLASKIKAGRLEPTFQVRHVQQKKWQGLSRAEDIQNALAVLADCHWLELIETEGLVRGSRPKIRYLINPKVLE